MENNRAAGRHWQRDLVAQMSLSIADMQHRFFHQRLAPLCRTSSSFAMPYGMCIHSTSLMKISVLGDTGDGNREWGT